MAYPGIINKLISLRKSVEYTDAEQAQQLARALDRITKIELGDNHTECDGGVAKDVLAEQARQIAILVNRMTEFEITLARLMFDGEVNINLTKLGLPPEGLDLPGGARLSAITIVEEGDEAPEKAALRASVSEIA